MKRLLLIATLFALASLPAFAADLAGEWISTRPAQVMKLSVDGAKITGTVQSNVGQARITEGTVDGNNVTIVVFVVLSGGMDPLGLGGYDAYAEEGQITKITYKGTISGSEMKLKIAQQGLDSVRELTLTKKT